jgi:hypothetical protein
MTNQFSSPSSFRDPSGYIFFRDNFIFRQINFSYKENYDELIRSGLYDSLVNSGILIPHREVGNQYAQTPDAYKVIQPERIPFVSYPYEWCFSQLKDAALTTLEIQKHALKFDFSLKDCSAYNIQFSKGKAVFIDTLSFEKYREGHPWTAYRQFCQHFLAPLALMHYVNAHLGQLSRLYLDGIPLDIASSLLPNHTILRFPLFIHIHLHAKAMKRWSGKNIARSNRRMGRRSFLGMLENLQNAIERLEFKNGNSVWSDYYSATNYSSASFSHKKELVSAFLDQITPTPKSVWDLGANTGVFSRIASKKGIQTMAFDMDPYAVEKNYMTSVSAGESHILPLVIDLANPSPGIGWQNRERASLLERGPVDVIFALALVHHLAIGNNLPIDRIAEFFHRLCRWLIIEFVPKSDSQTQKLLASREDIFPHYSRDYFESEFKKVFTFQKLANIHDTDRTLYLMFRK